MRRKSVLLCAALAISTASPALEDTASDAPGNFNPIVPGGSRIVSRRT